MRFTLFKDEEIINISDLPPQVKNSMCLNILNDVSNLIVQFKEDLNNNEDEYEERLEKLEAEVIAEGKEDEYEDSWGDAIYADKIENEKRIFLRYFSKIETKLYDCFCYPALQRDEVDIISYIWDCEFPVIPGNADLYFSNFGYSGRQLEKVFDWISGKIRWYFSLCVKKILDRIYKNERYFIEEYDFDNLKKYNPHYYVGYKIYDSEKDKILIHIFTWVGDKALLAMLNNFKREAIIN